MNFVSTIVSFLAPAIINKIAGSLGINQGLAGKAITAAIPAILAALTGAASRSGGGSALSDVLAKQDPGILGNFANMLGGEGQQGLIDSGSNALSSLLGGTTTGALTGAIGKFAGIDSNQSGSLMGVLAPVVLGQLAKTQTENGLDAKGLTGFLNSQKDAVAAAMPAGFSDLLKGSGVLDALPGISTPSAPSKPKAPTPVASAAPAGRSGMTKILLPVALGVAALYFVMSYGLDDGSEKTTAPVAPAVTTPAATAPAALPEADLAGIATKALGALTTSLGTIKDEATAKAAVPALQDTGKQIDGLKLAAAALSVDARKPIAALVAGALPSIVAAVEKAVGIPGAGAILNPVLQPIVANLEGLSK